MASFGQRIGRKPIRDVMQTDGLDASTRTELWNLIYPIERGLLDRGDSKALPLMKGCWSYVFRFPVDEFSWGTCESRLKKRINRDDWVDTMETIEGFAELMEKVLGERFSDEFRRRVNLIFTEELVGFRFVGDELVPVDDEQSAEEIESAISAAGNVARAHLERAVSLLADLQSPQYAKVAGEAVMAVEAEVHALTGKKTLGDGVKELGRLGLPVHPAIVKAWSAMYGYTSAAGGIRHANINGEEVDAAMAVYLLVTCSAFVNLLAKVAATSTSKADSEAPVSSA